MSPHLEPWRCHPLGRGRHCPCFLPLARSTSIKHPYNCFFVSQRLCIGVIGCLLPRFFSDLACHLPPGLCPLLPRLTRHELLCCFYTAPTFQSLPLQLLVPTLMSLPLFTTASAFEILFKGGSISISSTCPRPTPYYIFITSWVLWIPLLISSQLTWFFRLRPGRFHRLLWDLFTKMVPIS